MGNEGVSTSLWRRAEIRWLVTLTSLGFTSFFLTLAALPYWAAEAGVPIGAAGLVTTVMLAATVAVQTVVPGLVRKAGTTRVRATGVVLLGAAAPLYLLRDGLAWLLLVSVARGRRFRNRVRRDGDPVRRFRARPASRRGGGQRRTSSAPRWSWPPCRWLA